MKGQTINASLILLALVFAAVIVYHFDIASSKKVSGLASRVSFPEQKFLLNGPIDINLATAEELEAIPRIGPSLAKKIIEFRSAHGGIKSIDQLLEVKGVGPSNIKIIGQYITVH